MLVVDYTSHCAGYTNHCATVRCDRTWQKAQGGIAAPAHGAQRLSGGFGLATNAHRMGVFMLSGFSAPVPPGPAFFISCKASGEKLTVTAWEMPGMENFIL